ncbi:MAG: carboxypeptidase-like regulatory domain-containing protein, partial [Planctomycetota bacterium]
MVTVRDAQGPILGAVVRVQATEISTFTDEAGRFTLTGLIPGDPVTISAWKHLYYCAKVEGIVAPASDVTLSLIRYQTNDNPDYEWIPPIGTDSCASCKPGVTQIWLNNAHAGSANNPRFLTIYNGTDTQGNQSPPTRYGYSRDYGR